MDEITTDRLRDLLRDLADLVSQSSKAEAEIDQIRATRDQQLIASYRGNRDERIHQFESEIRRLRGQYAKLREESTFRHDSDSYQAVQRHEKFEKDANAKYESAQNKAKRRFQNISKDAEQDYETNKDRPHKKHLRFERQCELSAEELAKTRSEAGKILKRRGCDVEADIPEVIDSDGQDPMDRFAAAQLACRRKLREMERQPAARFLESGWPFLIFLFVVLATVFPLCYSLGWVVGAIAATAGGAVIAIVVWQCVRPIARRQTLACWPPLQSELAIGSAALKTAVARSKSDAIRLHDEMVEKKEDLISEAHSEWSSARVELAHQHQIVMDGESDRYQSRRQQIKATHEQEIAAYEAEFPPAIQKLESDFATDSQSLTEQHQSRLLESRQRCENQWAELAERWQAGVKTFGDTVDGMRDYCDSWYPAWDRFDAGSWQSRNEDVTLLRFGELKFDLGTLPCELPKTDRLTVDRTEYDLPATLTYPEYPSLVYKCADRGRDQAIASLQNVMLRLLTTLPPGKVRFTIVDPVGLGQNFSAFMHLADFDERLVSSRIWTEQSHVTKRLSDLTEHMENVIQKYLRNEFDSIQEYNKDAGEVAEPFQVLVVANFPANFSEEAVRRLLSIASSGPRCGVYTLVSVDTKMKMPRNFELADLEKHAVTLDWRDDRFVWQEPGLDHLPLNLDQPPSDDKFTEIVRAVGELSKDANRVEVPFESVVADVSQWWTGDSRSEVVVPLGRAGATKTQSMRLGKGTSQHVLIAGKTGSGKSTLLHALITNLSICYNPHEVQFYLIDFKKGVEFKAYAAMNLPHARVVAIESEREFGISVLDRLDVELKRRGDLFREAGVQDLKGYRDANPETVMPRIMLIIDEFQEFFVKDDKIGQDAALLLDRLVRQGRAFGIHVLLGSQTLAGAYSLARSTLGQMAVRIALQCSEADAHLILSDDNTAARLLDRPGEAIYNDANGLFEGNHPFQVVWLPDHQREFYLREIGELARKRDLPTLPPIVFEGNVASDPARNLLLRRVISEGPPATAGIAPRAWLGEAVAIKDPAAAVFRRQSGNNLLMVGQQEEMALGVLANAVIGLSAELVTHTADPARVIIFDGERHDSPTAGFWSRLVASLPWAGIQIADNRRLAELIGDVSSEVDRRLATSDDTAAPIFLVIYNLARFRELRKSEDFSFSLDENDAAGVDKQLANILREGPSFGVHALLWCDTFNSVNRWFDRKTINDMGLRVLFQMSATDSANLMESPEAGRLGAHRAILYREEQGEFEKFRPYGLPTDEWIEWVRENIGQESAAI